MNLTPRQKIFAAKYAETGKAAESAIAAGYSKKNASAISSRLVKKSQVQEELQRLAKQSEKRGRMTLDQADEILEELILAKIPDYQQALPDGCSSIVIDKDSPHPHAVKKVTVRVESEGEGDGKTDAQYITLELHDKLRALELWYRRKGALIDRVAQTDTQGRDVVPLVIGPVKPVNVKQWQKYYAKVDRAMEQRRKERTHDAK